MYCIGGRDVTFNKEWTMNKDIVLNLVSGETLVLPSILMEDDGFVKLIKSNASFQTLIDYVNENF